MAFMFYSSNPIGPAKRVFDYDHLRLYVRAGEFLPVGRSRQVLRAGDFELKLIQMLYLANAK